MEVAKVQDEIIELSVNEVQTVSGGSDPVNNPPGLRAALSADFPQIENDPPG